MNVYRRILNPLTKSFIVLMTIQLVIPGIKTCSQPTGSIIPGIRYEIKNKVSGKVLEVKNGNLTNREGIWQNNINLSQRQQFIFAPTPDGYYNIEAEISQLMVTVNVPTDVVANAGEQGSSDSHYGIMQDVFYPTSVMSGIATRRNPVNQKWQLIPTTEPSTFIIKSLRNSNQVLQPASLDSRVSVQLYYSTGANNQKWIIRQTRPDQSKSEIGLGPLWIDISNCSTIFEAANKFGKLNFDAADVRIADGRADINPITPQLRSVGETRVYSKPFANYQVLKGIVKSEGCRVAVADFPTSHFTHDIDFRVTPDPGYEHLLGAQFLDNVRMYPIAKRRLCEGLDKEIAVLQKQIDAIDRRINDLRFDQNPEVGPISNHPIDNYNRYRTVIERLTREMLQLKAQIRNINDSKSQNNCTKVIFNNVYDEYQTDIAVEWETGLGQDLDVTNPAKIENKKGNSFGFASIGHERTDVIWNWPSPGDRVHVEGMWVWERGYPPVHTEIHPPHFLAVQRKLPVSFILNVNNQNPIVRNDIRDNFIATRVDVMAHGDGSVYWNTIDVLPLEGEKFSQAPQMNRKDYSIIIHHPFQKPRASASLAWQVIKQKADNFPADLLIRELSNGDVEVIVPWKTAHVNNKAKFARTILVYWNDPQTKGVIQSELPKLYRVKIAKVKITDSKELRHGEFRIFCNVGSEWIFLNEFPVTGNILNSGLGSADEGSYNINKYFKLYIPPSGSYRIFAGGWEADGINQVMGMTLNGYDRNAASFKRFACNNLVRIYGNGDSDDEIGTVNKTLSQVVPMLGVHTFKNLNHIEGAFELEVEIEEVHD